MELRERRALETDEDLDEQQKSILDQIDASIQPMKKKYKSISESTKRKLLTLTKEQGLSIKKVAKKLRINYFTAKSICYNHKKDEKSPKTTKVTQAPKKPCRKAVVPKQEIESTGKSCPEDDRCSEERSPNTNFLAKMEDISSNETQSAKIKAEQVQASTQLNTPRGSNPLLSLGSNPFLKLNDFQHTNNNYGLSSHHGYFGHNLAQHAFTSNSQYFPQNPLLTNSLLQTREVLAPKLFPGFVADTEKLLLLERLKMASQNLANTINNNVSFSNWVGGAVPSQWNAIDEVHKMNLLKLIAQKSIV
mmetsp:Transcript_25295/g.29403  ORF Transcript_25295/g.29403 Transcript_25295/m.29403 type:complete len:305 (+) Transcript_25295:35-949(+)